jgi:type IV secretory pathway VirB10-like protein
MRAATAYFAGVGTVAVAIAAGLGGGLLLGDIMSPQQPKHQSSEVTRLEQRSTQAPIPAKSDASQPVPYLASSQAAATIAEPQPPTPKAETPPQAEKQPQQMQPQQAQQQPQQAAAQQAETKQADNKKAQPPKAQPVAAAEQPAASERAAPEDSFAKADDADIKREARRAEDRRKAERRQRWAEKRRIKARERDNDDLRDVEASVREATGERSFFGRPMFDSEPRVGSRSIGLFDD